MNIRTYVKQILRMCGHAMVSTIHERLDRAEQRTLEVEASLLQASIHTVETLHSLTDAVVVQTSDRRRYTSELGLMEFLYSYVPARKALDIGASLGDVSAGLLDSGFEVYALEPDPALFHGLEERLKGRAGFHAFCPAGGEEASETPLPVAEPATASCPAGDSSLSGISPAVAPSGERVLTGTAVASRGHLADLYRTGMVPEDFGLVHIKPAPGATGAGTLDVIGGMGDPVYPVVVVEFHAPEVRDGQPEASTVQALVREMRSRGYPWHIVLYRISDRDRFAFYSNDSHTVPNSSGSVFFFRDHKTFARARDWCAAVLPVTYFRPARAVWTP